MQLTREQYEILMMGLNLVRLKIRDANPQKSIFSLNISLALAEPVTGYLKVASYT